MIICLLLQGCCSDRITKEPTHTKDISMTETIRQEYLNAHTRDEFDIARAKMVKDFRSRYPRIDGGGTNKERLLLIKQMIRLMQEWNPILWKPKEVKAILGTPSKETDQLLQYTIDIGIMAAIWQFGIEDGDVISVKYITAE